MNIKTEYNIGDTIWTIDRDEVKSFKVQEIRITVGKALRCNTGELSLNFLSEKIIIEYAGNNIDYHTENKCFPTKCDLIGYLKYHD